MRVTDVMRASRLAARLPLHDTLSPMTPPSEPTVAKGPGTRPGVSFVIPVHNGAAWLDLVLTAIHAAPYGGPSEIIAIDDGSTDNSREVLMRHVAVGRLTLLNGERRGAAAAMNLGIRAAAHPLIAQVDQDVVIHPEWLDRLVEALDDKTVAAAQGHYLAAPEAGPWPRVMGLDLKQRYRRLGRFTNHVCTGNSVYRAAALRDIGGFDETLGYGYDNDVSYRLAAAGYRLAFRRDATSTHFWREGVRNYARQQYGQGYGRLDLIAKHRRRIGGDDVSRLSMMLHGPAMAAALVLAAVALGLWIFGGPATPPAIAAGLLLGALAVERFAAGLWAAVAWRDRAGLWFVPAHLVRDAAWAAAIAVWCARRVRGIGPRPAHSMRSSPHSSSLPSDHPEPPTAR